ncbi:MAG: hypothetical protein NC396_03045 [Bacteroides sp.]|nr:hypothetical protein [Bacteroides sp.]MCM1085192.1 hypothetical protein [Bacteroides sp.]
MKAIIRLVLSLFFVFSVKAFAQENIKKVAITEPIDMDNNKVASGVKLLLRGRLSAAISAMPGYSAFTRDFRDIMSEHEFQRSGLASDESVKRLGAATGAAYVLRMEVAYYDAKNITLSASLVDVETFETFTAATIAGIVPTEMDISCKALVKDLFGNISGTKIRLENYYSSPIHTADQLLVINENIDYAHRDEVEKIIDAYTQSQKVLPLPIYTDLYVYTTTVPTDWGFYYNYNISGLLFDGKEFVNFSIIWAANRGVVGSFMPGYVFQRRSSPPK